MLNSILWILYGNVFTTWLVEDSISILNMIQ